MKHSNNGSDTTRSFMTLTIRGPIRVKAYTPYSFPYTDINPDTFPGRRSRYHCAFMTFDVETYSKMCENPYAWVYHWQACVDGIVCFGRTLEDYEYFMDQLCVHLDTRVNNRLVIYSHNLGYEFQFIKRMHVWTDVFARSKKAVIRACTSKGLEFRCSYLLSNESLEKFCQHQGATFVKVKNEIVDENEGYEYDYSKFRTPCTPMTDEELSYCYNDVYGLWECINSLLREDTLDSIPLTSTGYVRRDVRNAVMSNKYSRYVKSLALTPELYTMCKEAFRGGDVHANYLCVGEVHKSIDSFDYKSSYPAVMLMEQFPSTPFIKLSESHLQEYLHKGLALLFHVKLFGVTIKDHMDMPYISVSKALEKSPDYINDNGRILECSMLSLCITEIDYHIIHDVYSIEYEEITDLYGCEKGYLPTGIREQTLEYFRRKTLLDGEPDSEYEYMKSKNRLNSIFGMMCTDITNDEYVFNGTEFEKEKPDLTDAIATHYNSRKLFLAYQWGIWVTAYARLALHRARKLMDNETIYQDTDSIKLPSGYKDRVEEFNAEIMRKIKSSPIQPCAPTRDGKMKYMGLLEYEGTYDLFITWGSKKYAVKKDGKVSITVAGLSKSKGREKLEKDGFHCFRRGWRVEPSGNMVAYYNEEPLRLVTEGGDTFTVGSSCAMFDTAYTLDITDEYSSLTGK